MSLSVKEILNIGASQLMEAGVESSERESKDLLCYLLKIDMSKLFLEYQNILQDIYCDQYFALLDRRSMGEPLQYIIGEQEFMGLPFFVDERVLIPRPETESLVELALEIIEKKSVRGEAELVKGNKSWKILDLCSGSGAIGISIAKLAKGKNYITCGDYSKDALDVARINAKNNGVDKDLDLVETDMFKAFKGMFKRKKFNMIVSNPPYIEKEVISTLKVEVKKHEPMMALDGGEDGLDFYRIIASESGNYLHSKGILLLEIGHNQGENVKTLLEQSQEFCNIKIFKDLVGNDRIVFAIKQ